MNQLIIINYLLKSNNYRVYICNNPDKRVFIWFYYDMIVYNCILSTVFYFFIFFIFLYGVFNMKKEINTLVYGTVILSCILGINRPAFKKKNKKTKKQTHTHLLWAVKVNWIVILFGVISMSPSNTHKINAGRKFRTGDSNSYRHCCSARKWGFHLLFPCEDEILPLGTLSGHSSHQGQIAWIFHSSWGLPNTLVSECEYWFSAAKLCGFSIIAQNTKNSA